MYIGFTRAVVTTLYGIIKQAKNTIAVILIILCSINAPLRRNRVSTPRGILVAKRFYLVAQFTQRCCCAGACKPSTYNDNFQFTLIGWVHQFTMSFVICPFLFKPSRRYF